MEKKNQKTKTVDNDRRKKILLGVLIPTGVLAVTAAIVPPCVIMCAKTKDEEGVQVDKDNWTEAMKYVYDLGVSSNYTCNGSNDGSKQFIAKVDGDKQYCQRQGSSELENTFYKKVGDQYKKYDPAKSELGWVDVEADRTAKYGMFADTFSNLINYYEKFTFKDGIYTYSGKQGTETYQIDIKLIKVDGKTRVKSLKMFVVETQLNKGWYTFSDFGKTQITLPE